MGDVVSIKKSTDDDLQMLFEQACSDVPTAVNDKVKLAANNALSGGSTVVYQPSFKVVCLIVAGACIIGALLVKGVTTRWSKAVDSAAMYSVQSGSVNQEPLLGAAKPVAGESTPSWLRSKAAWAEYIARLESDPFYQHVQREKRRFEARFPRQSSEQPVMQPVTQHVEATRPE